MSDEAPEEDRFVWRLPVYVAPSIVIFLLLVITLFEADTSVLICVFSVLVLTFALVVLLLREAFARRFRMCIFVASTLAISWAILAPMVLYNVPIRRVVRWLLWSHHYKAKVLAEPARPDGELKHIEWDGWGFAGMDTTVYLVFDPTDSLSTAAKNHNSGAFAGIPCQVTVVRRLESRWYTVKFDPDEFWDRCNN